ELVIDRDAAARFGVDVRDIDTGLYNAFGQRPVGVIYNPLNQYRVVLELDEPWLDGPHGLQQVWLRGRDGAMVPLASLAGQRDGVSALSIGHQGGAVAVTTSFAVAEGYALSEATAAVRAALADLGMPSSLRGSFEGSAGAFGKSMESQPMLIAAAILTIYLVLGILYESFLHPLTILSTLPSAGLGALIALQATGLPFTVIALIGVFLLIGIVKKNAILVIDFALAAQRNAARAGARLSPGTAIYRACLRRVRPIPMTTAAAALGAGPLALGSGDGAALRQPPGVAVGGGLTPRQLLTPSRPPGVFLRLARPARCRRPGPFRHGKSRMNRLLLPLAGMVAALAGCAVTDTPPPPPVEAPAAFRHAPELPVVAREPVRLPPADEWWRSFADPELDRLAQLVAERNEDIRAAAARVAQARAILAAQRSRLWPSVGASAGAARSDAGRNARPRPRDSPGARGRRE